MDTTPESQPNPSPQTNVTVPQPTTPTLQPEPQQSTGWAQWAQNQLGRMFYQPQVQPLAERVQTVPPSPQLTPTTTPSSTSTTPPSSEQSGDKGVRDQGEIKPEVDENGYPTSEAYLKSQGLDLVGLNRAAVDSQESLNQIYQILADPQQAPAFIAEYQRQLVHQQSSQPSQPQQQNFPQMPTPQSAQSLDAQYQQVQNVFGMGLPIGQEQQVLQAYDAIPDSTWRELAPYLIQER